MLSASCSKKRRDADWHEVCVPYVRILIFMCMAACMQDADEGFVEEEGKKKADQGMAPPLGLPAHFALEGTAEHSIVSALTAPFSVPR